MTAPSREPPETIDPALVQREGRLHRDLYREELRIPHMTVRQVPAETEAIPIGDRSVEVTDSGPLGGMAFSGDLNRRLGPPSGYGERYPWAHSWSYLRRACRHDHPGHTARPTFGGALCWQAVSYYVVSEFEPDTIARLMDLPIEAVHRHLHRAFTWIIEDMDRKQRIRNARDPQPSEEPTPTRISLLQCDAVNRAVADFDLEQRIWESHRRLHPELNLVEWAVEWSRRQVALIEHRAECERCRRAA